MTAFHDEISESNTCIFIIQTYNVTGYFCESSENMESSRHTVDLTKGPIGKTLLIFFLPIAAGNLFQQLYNTADALIIAKFVGREALAAVGGSSSQIIKSAMSVWTR